MSEFEIFQKNAAQFRRQMAEHLALVIAFRRAVEEARIACDQAKALLQEIDQARLASGHQSLVEIETELEGSSSDEEKTLAL